MSDDVQTIYQDIAHVMSCQQEAIDITISTLCQSLTTSHMSMALLAYWLIREDRRDHPVYKQFMMVLNRIKKRGRMSHYDD